MATPTPDDVASELRQRADTQLKRGLASVSYTHLTLPTTPYV